MVERTSAQKTIGEQTAAEIVDRANAIQDISTQQIQTDTLALIEDLERKFHPIAPVDTKPKEKPPKQGLLRRLFHR